MDWTPLGANDEMSVGNHYRVTLWVRTPEKYRKPLENTLKGLESFYDKVTEFTRTELQGIKITSVYSTAANPNTAEGRVGTWPLYIEFDKVRGSTPILVIAGAIIAVLMVLGWFLLVTKKEFHQATADVTNLATSTVFNPGVILAALVVVGIIWGKR